MITRYGDPELSELEKQASETSRADRSVFVQELLLSSLAEGLRLEEDDVIAGNSALNAPGAQQQDISPSPEPPSPAAPLPQASQGSPPRNVISTPPPARDTSSLPAVPSPNPIRAVSDHLALPRGGSSGGGTQVAGTATSGGLPPNSNSSAAPVRGTQARRVDSEKEREPPAFKVAH